LSKRPSSSAPGSPVKKQPDTKQIEEEDDDGEEVQEKPKSEKSGEGEGQNPEEEGGMASVVYPVIYRELVQKLRWQPEPEIVLLVMITTNQTVLNWCDPNHLSHEQVTNHCHTCSRHSLQYCVIGIFTKAKRQNSNHAGKVKHFFAHKWLPSVPLRRSSPIFLDLW
jgi:hypothetical protein